MSGKYTAVAMFCAFKFSKFDRRVIIQRIKHTHSKQINITVGKISALRKMSARAGATNVEMAEPINKGQKGVIVSLHRSIMYTPRLHC
jgi:hypothetical protein